jgi:hypothetical protein
MDSVDDHPDGWGFPIRKSSDQSVLATPRSLSQPATSFIASQCQGIRQTPLLCLISRFVSEMTILRSSRSKQSRLLRSVSARSVQGTTPTHETAFLPNPSTLPRRQSEDLDFKTSSLPMNDVKERYRRRHTALCSMRWWRQTGSNRRPPACKAGALPTELCPRLSFRSARSALRPPARTGCYPKEEPIARLGGPGRI